ncbi:MAG: hypothetical protein AB7E70_19390 [Hyphomicrobiaceae bacterium]
MAERTRKVRLLDAPDHGTLDLELRWIGNKDMRASAQPLADASEDERYRLFLERFAQHVIKSWSAGDYSVTSGLALLMKLKDADGDALNAIINRTLDPADFGVPRLVDPDDLGNE